MQNFWQNLGATGCKGRVVVLLAGLLFLGAACSAEESAPQVDVDRGSTIRETRAGTLLAEYPSGRVSHSDGVRVHAQFLDIHGIDYARALEALEVWSPDFELDLDACELHSAALSDAAPPEQIQLELLDVGPITVDTLRESVRLEARRLPDLLSLFSGVIYGTEQGFGRAPSRLAFEPGAVYAFSAPGSQSSGGFRVSLPAPRPIYLESVGDQLVDDRAAVDFNFTDDLRITWRPASLAFEQGFLAHAGEDVFLRISAGFGPDRPRLNCRLEDDGAFHLPAALLQQIAGDATELEVSLRRITARDVAVDGLERAEFVFSTVDQIILVDARR